MVHPFLFALTALPLPILNFFIIKIKVQKRWAYIYHALLSVSRNSQFDYVTGYENNQLAHKEVNIYMCFLIGKKSNLLPSSIDKVTATNLIIVPIVN